MPATTVNDDLFAGLMEIARTRTVSFTPRSLAGAKGYAATVFTAGGDVQHAGYGDTPTAALTDLVIQCIAARMGS